MIKKNLNSYKEKFDFNFSDGVNEIIFSQKEKNEVQKGDYIFIIDMYGIGKSAEVLESKMILGGKAFGLMGTDELRRDLAVG